MIEVKNLTKKYGKFVAIENLSLTVGKSSVYGLVGYNGAGKTTLLKTIAGIFKPDAGSVTIDGKDVFSHADARRKMFYVPDDLYFGYNYSIEKMAKFYAGYYPDFSYETLDKLCGVFKLDKTAKINSFSKGMQRQAAMILGMSTLPEILLLDESFDGLDPAKRNMMNNMLIEYAADKECSIIVSSHNLHELVDICDHIALINGKKIVFDCSVDEMSASRCKFRVVFNEEKEESDFSDFDIKRFEKDGKIVTLSLGGNAEENEEKLKNMSPLLVEKYPLTLEEIFLEEMEDTDYDFKEIFG